MNHLRHTTDGPWHQIHNKNNKRLHSISIVSKSFRHLFFTIFQLMFVRFFCPFLFQYFCAFKSYAVISYELVDKFFHILFNPFVSCICTSKNCINKKSPKVYTFIFISLLSVFHMTSNARTVCVLMIAFATTYAVLFWRFFFFVLFSDLFLFLFICVSFSHSLNAQKIKNSPH